jgi:pimeloyl-ACP methyl ester carboxylesterase
MTRLIRTASVIALLGLFVGACVEPAPAATGDKPTIVLVHGAFAESSSWNGVIALLAEDDYPVVAVANPLRGAASDGAYLSTLLDTIDGPIVLVGHSYGGAVISAAANGHENVRALVFVDAFAPDTGETLLALSQRFPGATLGDALAPPVELGGGSQDIYINPARYREQFAADVPAADVVLMSATQRPIAQVAFTEVSGQPAWRDIPTFSIYGSADLNIPPAALAFMAERAHSRHTVVINGGSHVVMVSHPAEVAALVEEAAALR